MNLLSGNLLSGTGDAPGRAEDARALAARTWAAVAPLIAQAPWVRRSPDGGQSFPAKYQRKLTAVLPDRPATVPVFDRAAGTGRLLVADLDVSRARALGAADPHGRVALEAASLVSLVEACGGRAVVDVSPSGGRHVYVLFSEARPWNELRELACALARRFPTMDTGPMNGPGGQIRPPGAPHKLNPGTGRLSGWMRLTVPVAEAVAVLNRPCGPQVWGRLHSELAVELDAYLPARPGADPRGSDGAEAGPGGGATTAPLASLVSSVALVFPEGLRRRAGERPVEVDEDGVEWLPRPGGRRAPRTDLAELAVYGAWEGRYASASEARLAVLNSIASAGWKLGEVIAEMEHGQWGGLKQLLQRRRARDAARRLKGDWQKAIDGLRAGNPASRAHTSPTTPSTPPPTPTGRSDGRAWPGPAAGAGHADIRIYFVDSATRCDTHRPEPVLNTWQQILRWNNALWLAERDPARQKAWGGSAPSIRLLLRAMAVAARMDGSTTPAFGVRNLALMCGLDHSTVAALLKLLREEDDPLIERIVIGRGKAGDRYQLLIPDAYRAHAAWRRWRGGRIDTTHPALHRLGATTALVYEVLSAAPTGSSELARLALVSRASTTRALRTLAALQLAVREPSGWVRGERDLDAVAAETGADLEQAERLAAIRAERAAWHAVLASWDLPAYQRPTPTEQQATSDPGAGDTGAAAAEPVPWPTAPSDADRLLPPDDERLPAPAPDLAGLLDMDDAVALVEQMLGARPLPAARPAPRTPAASPTAAWPTAVPGRAGAPAAPARGGNGADPASEPP